MAAYPIYQTDIFDLFPDEIEFSEFLEEIAQEPGEIQQAKIILPATENPFQDYNSIIVAFIAFILILFILVIFQNN